MTGYGRHGYVRIYTVICVIRVLFCLNSEAFLIPNFQNYFFYYFQTVNIDNPLILPIL